MRGQILTGKIRSNRNMNLSQCHFVHQTPHNDCPGIELGPPSWVWHVRNKYISGSISKDHVNFGFFFQNYGKGSEKFLDPRRMCKWRYSSLNNKPRRKRVQFRLSISFRLFTSTINLAMCTDNILFQVGVSNTSSNPEEQVPHRSRHWFARPVKETTLPLLPRRHHYGG
jgi:hypothetical protein